MQLTKKNKQDKTKPIKPNNPQISIHKIYILLTGISNVTFNPQIVLFNRLPLLITHNSDEYITYGVIVVNVM